MLTIIYDPTNGAAIQDGFIRTYVNRCAASAQLTANISITSSSELAVRAVRNAVLEGRTSHDNVQFEFHGVTITINSDGLFTPHPAGFCDMSEQLAMGVMSLRAQQRRLAHLGLPDRPQENNATLEEVYCKKVQQELSL